MKFLDIIKTSGANLWSNKGRTLLTIIAIFIGAFTISLTSGVNAGINDYIERQFSRFSDNTYVWFMAESSRTNVQLNNEPKEYDEHKTNTSGDFGMKMVTSEDVEKIKTIKGISSVELSKGALISTDYVQYKDGKKLTTNSVGAVEEGINLDIAEGRAPHHSTKDFEVAIPQDFLKSLGFKSSKDALNQEIKFQTTNKATGEKIILTAKIVGVMNKNLIQNGQFVISKSFENEIYEKQFAGLPEKLKDQSLYILAKPNNPDDKEEFERIKKDAAKLGYAMTSNEETLGIVKNVINSITGALTVFGAIALLAASFGIINTLYMSVRERTREIGLMKSMGLSNTKIFALFSVEAILIGLAGSLIGFWLASLVGNALNAWAADNFLKGLDGLELTKFTLENGVLIAAIIGTIAFLAGVLPSRAAAKKDPIEALRYE